MNAEKLIEEHKNPIVKLNFSRKKLFKLEPTSQTSEVNEYLDILKKSIDTNRVERRCARSKLKWLADKHLAVAIHLVGSVINSYGFQDKTGKYFHPEETLFLLETNKIELLWNDVPMSIQQAYEVLLNSKKCGINAYRAYKKFVLQGFKVSVPCREDIKNYSPPRKRHKYDDKEQEKKKCETSEGCSSGDRSAVEFFEKLQANGPKRNDTTLSESECCYNIYKKDKKDDPDYRLRFLTNTFDPAIGYRDEYVRNIYCFPENDSFSFLRCSTLNIPNLF